MIVYTVLRRIMWCKGANKGGGKGIDFDGGICSFMLYHGLVPKTNDRTTNGAYVSSSEARPSLSRRSGI
ncbi:unnamed protein product [Calypogeia fissa]